MQAAARHSSAPGGSLAGLQGVVALLQQAPPRPQAASVLRAAGRQRLHLRRHGARRLQDAAQREGGVADLHLHLLQLRGSGRCRSLTAAAGPPGPGAGRYPDDTLSRRPRRLRHNRRCDPPRPNPVLPRERRAPRRERTSMLSCSKVHKERLPSLTA